MKMKTEVDAKPEIDEIDGKGGRIRYTNQDNYVIEDIISNFEGGWIQTELSKPNNGIQIREKRVWPHVAEEFNKRQEKTISADQLRRRFNCNKSTYKKKSSVAESRDGDVVNFIKSKVQLDAVPEFLTKSKLTLSNRRAEHFLVKSNLDPSSVWSSLLVEVLRDLIQARYLVEDGILMLSSKNKISAEQPKPLEASVHKVEVVQDVPEYISTIDSSTKSKISHEPNTSSLEHLNLAIDKVLEGIEKYSYVEQFLEMSIKHEEEVNAFVFTSEHVSEQKTETTDLKNPQEGMDHHVTSDLDHLPVFDLKQDITDDEWEEPRKEDIIMPSSDDQSANVKKSRKSTKIRKSTKEKSLKPRAKRRKFDDDTSNITCEHCGETCNTKRKFYNHMRKHLQDTAIICTVCNKGFQYKSQYELHFRKHTGERPYRCHICAAGFTQKNVLVDHLRTHSGEKPFKCDECFLEFSQRSNLKSHMTIHSGEKPFKCQICAKSFRLKDSLREHESLHTGVKAYKCDQCLKEFRVKGKLRKHLRKQHNITTFPKDQ